MLALGCGVAGQTVQGGSAGLHLVAVVSQDVQTIRRLGLVVVGGIVWRRVLNRGECRHDL